MRAQPNRELQSVCQVEEPTCLLTCRLRACDLRNPQCIRKPRATLHTFGF